MARSKSGRIVVEIEPELKQRLYTGLVRDGLTFREWLISQAENYLEEQVQPSIFESDTTSRKRTKNEF